MDKKGVTDIIAIVLLLMITVSMVGFAWMWLQGTFTRTAQNVTSQIQTQQEQRSQMIRIDAIDRTGGSVYVRNIGAVSIDTTRISVYVNGTSQVGACGWSGLIAPGSVARCTNAIIVGCASIKVTTPGSEDNLACY